MDSFPKTDNDPFKKCDFLANRVVISPTTVGGRLSTFLRKDQFVAEAFFND